MCQKLRTPCRGWHPCCVCAQWEGPRPAKGTQKQAALGGKLEPHSGPLLMQTRAQATLQEWAGISARASSVGSVCVLAT